MDAFQITSKKIKRLCFFLHWKQSKLVRTDDKDLC